MRSFVLLAVVVLFGAGCLDAANSPAPISGESVQLRRLVDSQNQPVIDGKFEGTLDQAAWDEAWARYANSTTEAGEKPIVDFATERIIAVATGQFGNGCNSVRIVNATSYTDGRLVVRYSQYQGDGLCTAQVVWPTVIVAVKDTSSVVSFEKSTTTEAPPQPESLSKRDLDNGSFSPIGGDFREALDSQVEWDDLWERHTKNQSRPQPAVDFPNETVIVAIEHGPTGCFGIQIGEVVYDPTAKRTTVEIIHIPTPPNVRCIQALVDAFDFVAIPTRDGSVDFVDCYPSPPAAQEFEMRTIEQGTVSNIHEKTLSVLSDDASWQAFWSKHVTGREAPEVNFELEQVFVAMAGDKPSGCWALEVTQMARGEVGIEVEVTTYSPPIDAFCTMIVSQPFHFVSYPWGEAPPLIREVTKQRPSNEP